VSESIFDLDYEDWVRGETFDEHPPRGMVHVRMLEGMLAYCICKSDREWDPRIYRQFKRQQRQRRIQRRGWA
jgi:hypothetical protein